MPIKNKEAGIRKADLLLRTVRYGLADAETAVDADADAAVPAPPPLVVTFCTTVVPNPNQCPTAKPYHRIRSRTTSAIKKIATTAALEPPSSCS
jgi:hypothetical protein